MKSSFIAAVKRVTYSSPPAAGTLRSKPRSAL
ncbi:Uncharacterised protein [Vibrio cholerae]|nr:Uncharacterised protein [Vibrio cholerae]